MSAHEEAWRALCEHPLESLEAVYQLVDAFRQANVPVNFLDEGEAIGLITVGLSFLSEEERPLNPVDVSPAMRKIWELYQANALVGEWDGSWRTMGRTGS